MHEPYDKYRHNIYDREILTLQLKSSSVSVSRMNAVISLASLLSGI